MTTVNEIIELARRLPVAERRKLIEELDALELRTGHEHEDRPYHNLLYLAGAVHSRYDDLSTNKYEHLGAAIAEHEEG